MTEYLTGEEKARRDSRAADRARRIYAGEPASLVPHCVMKWEYVGEQPTTVPSEMSRLQRETRSRVHIARMSLLSMVCSLLAGQVLD